MHTLLEVLLWLSAAGIGFSYLGYPLLVWALSRWKVRTHPEPDVSSDPELPEVTVLITAHNAERHIGERINNILACDYPRDRLRIAVASDGSTDDTVGVVRRFDGAHVQAIPFHHRRGKLPTLVDAVRRVQSEVIVFTDATSRFDRNALRQLTRHFSRPDVGLTAGKLVMVDERGVPAESLYWRTEMMVRRSEGQLGLMLGASGAIYAMRRNVFVEPPCPVINDDMVLPILTQLRHGCRAVFDETARAYALSARGLAGEFRRRQRIGAGAFQSLCALGELFRLRHARLLCVFLAHKLLRWLCPFLLLILLITNVSLMSAWHYRVFMWAQMAAYLFAAIGWLVPGEGNFARIARAASSFVVMNLALLTGFFRWLLAPDNVIWNPTPRPALDAASPVLSDP